MCVADFLRSLNLSYFLFFFFLEIKVDIVTECNRFLEKSWAGMYILNGL